MLPLLAMLAQPVSAAPPHPGRSADAARPRRRAARRRRPPAAAPPAGGGLAFPFPVTEKTLPNGLKIYVVGFDSPGLVAFYSVVRTGSRNEVEPGKSGFAHFFEHLMFRGSQNYIAEKYTAVIKEMGADSNAFTSDDLTVYHILAGKAALPKIVEIEADRFQRLQVRGREVPEGSARRAGRIQQERVQPDREDGRDAVRQRVHDPHVQAHDDGLPEGHREHAQGAGVLAAVLRSLLPPRERHHHGRRRRRPEAVFKLVEKNYGDWKRGGKHPAVPVEPPQKQEKRAALTWKGATLPMLLEGYHAPAFSTTNVDVPTLDVLAELLFAERAPLYKQLVIKEQKVESLSGSNDAHVDPNLFSVLARIKKPEDVAYVEKAIHDEMARIAREGVDEKTLAEVLSHVKYAFAGQLSTADKTAYTASLVPGADRRPRLDQRVLRALRQGHQRRRQARRARRYFAPPNRTVVTMKADEAMKALL